MKAPSVWEQVLIVAVGLALLPYVIRLLAKLRLLPLGLYFLAANLFTNWVADHKALSIAILIGCILYPVLTVIHKIVSHYQEERRARNYLLATATPLQRDQQV